MTAILGSIPAVIVLTGMLVGASAALLGSFLVLRGNAMLTDAISHSIVFGIVAVWLASGQLSGPVQLLGAGLTGLATVALSEALARSGLVRMDAAIGLVFPALFAAGVILITVFARDVHIDVDTVLLGEIGFVWLNTWPVAGAEVPVAMAMLGAVLVLDLIFVLAFWKELKLASFDPGLAAALGFAPGLLHYALLGLTSMTAVAAFDAVGAVLFIAFVIAPPATAFLLTRRLSHMVMVAVGLSLASSGAGYALAVALDVSIGGMMASVTGLWFALALALAPRQGLIAQALLRARQRRAHDCRTLVAHLARHEGATARVDANTRRTLQTHLGWTEPRARRTIRDALADGLVTRDATGLALRPKGRAQAQAGPD